MTTCRATLCLLAAAASALAADPPQPNLEISNGVLTAKLHLPDPTNGYYQGTRFDWAGVIASLERKGHTYFGVWFPRYDPKLHDAITGPVDSFNAIGYDEAAVGDKFLRIGVGWLKRPDAPKVDNFHTYDIVDGGKWTEKHGKDWVEFTHTLGDTYVYRKRVALVKDQLVIEHSLKNTGKKTLETDVFNHDFFMLDNQPTSPDIVVKFPFEPKSGADWRGPGEFQGKELVYKQELPQGVSVSGELTGYGTAAAEQDFRVENRKTGVGVHQTGDHPMSRLYFWSIRTTVCPEAYVHVKVEPGKEERWRSAFEFY
jgi:hypothetical protein